MTKQKNIVYKKLKRKFIKIELIDDNAALQAEEGAAESSASASKHPTQSTNQLTYRIIRDDSTDKDGTVVYFDKPQAKAGSPSPLPLADQLVGLLGIDFPKALEIKLSLLRTLRKDDRVICALLKDAKPDPSQPNISPKELQAYLYTIGFHLILSTGGHIDMGPPELANHELNLMLVFAYRYTQNDSYTVIMPKAERVAHPTSAVSKLPPFRNIPIKAFIIFQLNGAGFITEQEPFNIWDYPRNIGSSKQRYHFVSYSLREVLNRMYNHAASVQCHTLLPNKDKHSPTAPREIIYVVRGTRQALEKMAGDPSLANVQPFVEGAICNYEDALRYFPVGDVDTLLAQQVNNYVKHEELMRESRSRLKELLAKPKSNHPSDAVTPTTETSDAVTPTTETNESLMLRERRLSTGTVYELTSAHYDLVQHLCCCDEAFKELQIKMPLFKITGIDKDVALELTFTNANEANTFKEWAKERLRMSMDSNDNGIVTLHTPELINQFFGRIKNALESIIVQGVEFFKVPSVKLVEKSETRVEEKEKKKAPLVKMQEIRYGVMAGAFVSTFFAQLSRTGLMHDGTAGQGTLTVKSSTLETPTSTIVMQQMISAVDPLIPAMIILQEWSKGLGYSDFPTGDRPALSCCDIAHSSASSNQVMIYWKDQERSVHKTQMEWIYNKMNAQLFGGNGQNRMSLQSACIVLTQESLLEAARNALELLLKRQNLDAVRAAEIRNCYKLLATDQDSNAVHVTDMVPYRP